MPNSRFYGLQHPLFFTLVTASSYRKMSADSKRIRKKRRLLHESKNKVSATFRRPKVYWVPKDKNGPGRWVRPVLAPMNPKTLERLTRQKNRRQSQRQDHHTGRYLLPSGRFSLTNQRGIRIGSRNAKNKLLVQINTQK